MKDSNTPLISVLMSAYNAEKYIGESIESILQQSLRNFELLILDDNSTDSTIKIIEQYKKRDKRIRLQKNYANKGLTVNRNTLIKSARGKYIAWQDADDISLRDRLELQYELMETDRRLGIVGGYLEFFNDSGEISIRKYPIKDKQLKKLIFRYVTVSHPVAMIRRDVFTVVGFYNKSLKVSQDLDMLFRIGTKYKFSNVPKVLLKYREHSAQITSTKLKDQIKTTLRIRKTYSKHDEYKMNLLDKVAYILTLSALYLPSQTAINIFKFLRNE